jgi:hypothetical protein
MDDNVEWIETPGWPSECLGAYPKTNAQSEGDDGTACGGKDSVSCIFVE